MRDVLNHHIQNLASCDSQTSSDTKFCLWGHGLDKYDKILGWRSLGRTDTVVGMKWLTAMIRTIIMCKTMFMVRQIATDDNDLLKWGYFESSSLLLVKRERKKIIQTVTNEQEEKCVCRLITCWTLTISKVNKVFELWHPSSKGRRRHREQCKTNRFNLNG